MVDAAAVHLRRFVAVCLFAIAAAVLPRAAQAHPHVWIITTGELLYAPDGTLTGVRFAWEFDEMFSAAAVMGLDVDNDGKLSREELASLAKTNVDSLKEFDYFAFPRAGSRKLKFEEPVDYFLEKNEAGLLVLHFTLPLAKPQPAKGQFRLEVYDPTMFVSFAFADGAAPMVLKAAPTGCAIAFERPQPIQPGQPLTLSESFFNTLNPNSDYGAKFANRATVKCP